MHMHDTEQIFFLTPVEYAMLLAGKGVKRQYTLQADSVKIEEAEVCKAMNHLYQTGLIDSDSKIFQLREDLDRLISGIKDADYILCVRFGRHEKRDFCCFVGKEVITGLRLSRIDGNTYEIYETDKNTLGEVLIRGLETTQAHEPILDEDECYQKLRNSNGSLSAEVIRKYRNLLMAVERIVPSDGSVAKRFLVRFSETGICGDEVWNVSQSAGQRECKGEYIRSILEQMMESEED